MLRCLLSHISEHGVDTYWSGKGAKNYAWHIKNNLWMNKLLQNLVASTVAKDASCLPYQRLLNKLELFQEK